MLNVSEIFVQYGRSRILEGVSLTVAQGECVSLLGSNGAGKTTTLRTISGLLKPVSGRTQFNGADLAGMPAYKRVGLGIVHVPEGRRIFPDLLVRENLMVGAYSQAAPSPADIDRIVDLFPVLKYRLRQKGGSLSGGEQQMLAFARALMARPKLLMLDEPSLGLAPRVVEDLYEVLRKIKATVTVLLVEQSVHLALEVADRAYVLREGRIVGHGSSKDLSSDSWLRNAYLGSEVES
jgi:branched-chain amino acid transport system ATP-binding protein